jgi:hypothetical protein
VASGFRASKPALSTLAVRFLFGAELSHEISAWIAGHWPSRYRFANIENVSLIVTTGISADQVKTGNGPCMLQL